VSFIGTGLPSLPAVLSDATSYAERLYDYRTIGLLADSEARDALAHPVERRGLAWEPAALSAALVSVGGYPYFTQACGKHVWDVTTGTTITLPTLWSVSRRPATKSTAASTCPGGTEPPKPSEP
jgi:hypothetical protein